MIKTTQQVNRESGFALLLTLLVVTVLISIGLSVLTLSIQQVRLSSTARDSEIAFQAANAGLECAHNWRRELAEEMEEGRDNLLVGCFQVESVINSNQILDVTGDGDVYQYAHSQPWSSGDRCSVINTIIGVASSTPGNLVINNMPELVPGFPETTKECEPGTRCTVISVQGYNRACGDIDSFGTVQREVLLQL